MKLWVTLLLVGLLAVEVRPQMSFDQMMSSNRGSRFGSSRLDRNRDRGSRFGSSGFDRNQDRGFNELFQSSGFNGNRNQFSDGFNQNSNQFSSGFNRGFSGGQTRGSNMFNRNRYPQSRTRGGSSQFRNWNQGFGSQYPQGRTRGYSGMMQGSSSFNSPSWRTSGSMYSSSFPDWRTSNSQYSGTPAWMIYSFDDSLEDMFDDRRKRTTAQETAGKAGAA